jgi:hypothetical protein
MTAHRATPSLAPAYFWRWLLAGALLFAVVAQLELFAVLQFFAAVGLGRAAIVVSGFSITLVDLITGLAGAVAYALYAAIFLADYFLFQRFERAAERGFVPLWLLSILRLAAGILAAWLLRIVAGGVIAAIAATVHADGPVMSRIVFGLIEVIPNAAIGAGFGFLLWSLQHGYSDLLWHRSQSLLRAHVLGGAIGGSLLALAGLASGMAPALFQRRAPAVLSLMVLALAVVPHLTLTWRAMHPALAESARDMTGTGVFIARLIATLVPFAAAGVALHLLVAP